MVSGTASGRSESSSRPWGSECPQPIACNPQPVPTRFRLGRLKILRHRFPPTPCVDDSVIARSEAGPNPRGMSALRCLTLSGLQLIIAFAAEKVRAAVAGYPPVVDAGSARKVFHE